MHADTQRYFWAPKEKLGVFDFTEDGGDCFLSSAVALRKQNRKQKRNIAYGKNIHTEAEMDEIRGMKFCFYEII